MKRIYPEQGMENQAFPNKNNDINPQASNRPDRLGHQHNAGNILHTQLPGAPHTVLMAVDCEDSNSSRRR